MTRLLTAAVFAAAFCGAAAAHPLGNFTINHYARLEVGASRVVIHYVIDMAEIPAFQQLQAIAERGASSPTAEQLKAFADEAARKYAESISLAVDGSAVRLQVVESSAATPEGQGGLPTLRVECLLEGTLIAAGAGEVRRLRFEDSNFRDRIGWREIVVTPSKGVSIFDSTAFASGVTDELKSYPEDQLAAPLNERVAEARFTTGAVPAGSTALTTRDGRPPSQSRDRFAELIAVRHLTPAVALLGLLIAAALGALHALSPGHGKTIVGAYLVGSRGTARHAAFLGLTVTITHTLGVFALGLVTLFASQYVVPERLFPFLSFISGGMVLTIGLNLFVRRLRAALTHRDSQSAHHHHANDAHAHQDHHHHHDHSHAGHAHPHDHVHAHDHSHAHDEIHAHDHAHPHDHAHDHAYAHDDAHEASALHSHGGKPHSHLPPGADGSRLTWRSLLALGISGGLLPCPSALVVLLSAISLHRVGYGLLLVVAFSAGLAATLTVVGLAFLYAGRLMKRPAGSGRLMRVLPVGSALVITCAGAAICYEALSQAGLNLAAPIARLLGLFS